MGVNFFELPPHMWVHVHASKLLKKVLNKNEKATNTLFIYEILPSLQLRLGRQCLPNHADRVQQPFHPHLWWEWSREDWGLQEDFAVLRRQLSEHGSAQHCPGQNAHVQPRPRGRMGIYTIIQKCVKRFVTRVGANLFLLFCRLSAMPKHWKMTTQVDLGSTWTFSLTDR